LDLEQKNREKEEADRILISQLTKNAEIYNQIRDQLVKLATAVETDDKINSETKMLAYNILRKIQNIAENLKLFVQTPTTSNLDAVRPLIVLSREEITKFPLKEAGFSTFLCAAGSQTKPEISVIGFTK